MICEQLLPCVQAIIRTNALQCVSHFTQCSRLKCFSRSFIASAVQAVHERHSSILHAFEVALCFKLGVYVSEVTAIKGAFALPSEAAEVAVVVKGAATAKAAVIAKGADTAEAAMDVVPAHHRTPWLVRKAPPRVWLS